MSTTSNATFLQFQRLFKKSPVDTTPARTEKNGSVTGSVDSPSIDKEAGHHLSGHQPGHPLGNASQKLNPNELQHGPSDRPDEGAQRGVQKIEAVTLSWSMKSVYITLALIWLLTLVNNMKSTMVYSLSAYATSSFRAHSLLPVIQIVAGALGGAVYIPVAKALDLWGRAEGFLLMLVLCLLGIVLLAASADLPTYCAGEVFYSVGFGGLNYSWTVLASDITSLRNRGLAFAFTSSPAVISAFAASKAAEDFLLHSTWQWGYGMWAIVFPFIAIPIYLMLALHLKKAQKNGISTKAPRRDYSVNAGAVKWIFNEFDLIGVFLLASGMIVFLLPFTLAATAPQGWSSGYIIAMLVIGVLLIIAFGLHETFVAPTPFLKSEFLLDRTVLGAILLNMTYQISYYCYGSYLPSFLQVVYYLTVAEAGYVGNTFSACAFVFLFLAGYLVRVTGRYKWILWVCVPLYIFGLGLMIHFRTPGGNIGYIVMCEIFFSAAGSVFILCVQLAVLTSVDHQHVAAVLALLFVFGSIGGSLGSAICGAIWTNTFAPALAANLPADELPKLADIYASLPAQLAYPVGSPARDAIIAAYGYAQVIMLAAGTAFMGLGFVWVAMIRNVNVKGLQQTKGNVF